LCRSSSISCNPWFCLPILFRLCVPKKAAIKKRLPSKTKSQLAVELLQVLCERHENKRFHAVGDSAYGGKSVLCHLPASFSSGRVSRLAMNA
jgi:hypothetical protein